MGIYLPILGDGLPVVIQELDLPLRTMTFAGRDRPEQNVERETVQRDVQTWYPGQSQASTQVLGTKEEPVILQGWFRDPITKLDGGPAARVSLIRGIQSGQKLCALYWGDTIMVYGRIRRAKFGYKQQDKIRYEIEFTVDAAGAEFKALAPIPVGTSTALDIAQDLDSILAVMGDVVRVAEFVPGVGV